MLALTHRSFAYENGGLPTNERLEFLGDSVLGIVITDELYRRHADSPEGHLAKMRSAIVNARALAGVARTWGLGDHILLGKGEESNGGRDKSSILADTVEAVIGALYLQHGIDVTRRIVLDHFAQLLEHSAELGAGLDWKTSLQELTAEIGIGVPLYVIAEDGPDQDGGPGELLEDLRVGDHVEVLPIHICAWMDLQREVYGVRGGRLVETIAVDAMRRSR